MQKFVLSFSVFLLVLTGCQNSNDAISPSGSNATKVVLTEVELIKAITATSQFSDLSETQLAIDDKMPSIIHNASPSFIKRYRVVRDQYKSLTELAVTSSIEHHNKFVSLWKELLRPIQDLNDLRDKQYLALYGVISAKYIINQDDLAKAVSKTLHPQSNPNARLSDCQGSAQSLRDQAFSFCVSFGYGYSFSCDIAQDVYLDTLDECNGSNSAWC